MRIGGSEASYGKIVTQLQLVLRDLKQNEDLGNPAKTLQPFCFSLCVSEPGEPPFYSSLASTCMVVSNTSCFALKAHLRIQTEWIGFSSPLKVILQHEAE